MQTAGTTTTTTITRKQAYGLLGNSLSVTVVSELLKYLIVKGMIFDDDKTTSATITTTTVAAAASTTNNSSGKRRVGTDGDEGDRTTTRATTSHYTKLQKKDIWFIMFSRK